MTELIKITPEAIEKYRQNNNPSFLNTVLIISDSGRIDEFNTLVGKEYDEFMDNYLMEFPSLSDLNKTDFAEIFLYVNKATIPEYLGINESR